MGRLPVTSRHSAASRSDIARAAAVVTASTACSLMPLKWHFLAAVVPVLQLCSGYGPLQTRWHVLAAKATQHLTEA